MWREYALGMAAHLKLQLDLYMTTADRDWEREAILNELLISSEARRDAAREAIRQHEIAEHTRDPG
jgi:hypothetical protein